MLIKSAINEKSLNMFFAGLISCFFGLMILQHDFKAFAILGAMVFLLIFFTKIEYAFYFLLASRSIVDVFYDVEAAGDIRITQYMGVSVAALSLCYFLFSGYNIFRLSVNKVYGVFMGLSIVPIFFTQDFITGFGYWLKLLQGFLILNITILVVLRGGDKTYRKRIDTICWSIFIAFLIPYALFIKNYMQGTYYMMGGYIRYGTFGSYANLISYYLLSVFPVCLFFYSISARSSRKIFWFVFMALLLFSIYKTYTRNVWIGIAVLLLVWNLVRKNFKITAPVLCLIIFMAVFNPTVRDRFSDIYVILKTGNFFNLDPDLLSARVGIWQSNLHYFLNNSTIMEKLLGNGFDIQSAIANLRTKDSVEEHNNYLTLLMTTGICGLSVYLLYLFTLFRESFKLFRYTKQFYFKCLSVVFISVLFAYVIICFFTHMLWKINFQYYFSAFAGLVIAANILDEKNRISSDAQNPKFEANANVR
ncbi:MAG: O-antigen ligase family protein [Candidatus Brocadia sinica]|nr:O-antigen ligase family protein [Candidatus Brocadia sinica]